MIHFGTSGWRGVVGEEFTFSNVRRVVDAVAMVLTRQATGGEVVISYDTRLLSEKFAREAVAVLTHHGIHTVISDRDVPTPCLAHSVRERGAALGIMFTASHNPPEYNGVKLYTRRGTPAPHELTDAVEAEVAARWATFEDFFVPQRQLATTAALAEGYIARIEAGIDWDAIVSAGLVIAVDPLFGTAREFIDRVLLAHGVPTHVIHTTKDPYFGGYAPECVAQNLAGLRDKVREAHADLGLATDGDGDRFGVLDRRCRAIPANLIIALLTEYLLQRRRVPGAVGRTCATTRLVDRVAHGQGRQLIETPVGFSHLAPLLDSGEVGVAAEESAGLGVAPHLPERDGIYAALLVAEMVAVERRSLDELIRSLFARYGTLVSRRVQLPLKDTTPAALDRLAARTFTEFAGILVTRQERSDGLLLELADGSWVLGRLSGTEPKLRIYAEATSSRRLLAMVREARRLVTTAEEEEGHVRNR